MYGLYCDLNCSNECTDVLGVDASRCSQLQGHCRFGCNEGYFGISCNKTCSTFCIDKICIQETGKCTKGCDDVYNDVVCVLGSDTQKNTDNRPSTTIVVIVSISVFGATIAVAVGVIYMIWTRKCSKRKQQNTSTSVSFENNSAVMEHGKELDENESERNEGHNEYDEIENGSESVSKTQIKSYEEVVKVQTVGEHDYLKIHSSGPDRTVRLANEEACDAEYYNLNPI